MGLESDKTKNRVIVWGLLEHLSPFWSLGTNMPLLHEEKTVIRKEEEKHIRIKAKFSNDLEIA